MLLISFLIGLLINKFLQKTIKIQKEQFEELKLTQTKIISQAQLTSIQIISSGLAHDLNNIFVTILGNISLYKENKDLSPELQASFKEMEIATTNASNLANQLLNMGKNKQDITEEIHSLNKIIQNTANFVIKGRKSRIEFDLADDLMNVIGDDNRLTQVFQNLILNADQSMPQGGIITIRSFNRELTSGNEYNLPPGPFIQIEVLDTGESIPDEVKDKIFDLFYTSKNEGTGIGLTITKSIIDNHHGFIDFYPRANQGTCFFILLPALKSGQKKIVREETNLEIPQDLIFFIYDDNNDLITILTKLLMNLGVKVYSATNSKLAFELLSTLKEENVVPDVFILDLTLPGDVGGELMVDPIKDKIPSAYCIVSSGYSDKSIISDYKNYGFDDILRKPYSLTDLRKLIDNFLRQKTL